VLQLARRAKPVFEAMLANPICEAKFGALYLSDGAAFVL
jgi:hypothetical protein